MEKEVIMHWSGGKDAALSFYKLQEQGVSVNRFLTTISAELKRITMHGVRLELLQEQIKSLMQKVETLALPESISMSKYNDLMHEIQISHKNEGITHHAFGDIFLEDLKKYRDEELTKVGLTGLYPIWGMKTTDVIAEFLNLGFKAIIVAVSSRVLDQSFVGRTIDASFIEDLPEGVDPCGENGEFHTFVYDGPNFSYPIDFEIGEVTYKTYTPDTKDEGCFCACEDDTNWDKGFWFCDLLLKQ